MSLLLGHLVALLRAGYCRVSGLITCIFVVSVFVWCVVVLCTWLCFDSSPLARCPRGCVSAPIVSLLVSSSSFTPGSCSSRYLPLYSTLCFAVFCQTVVVYTIVLTAIGHYCLPVLSCLAQAPVLVAASLFSCTFLCAQVPVGLSRHLPSLGLCGFSSGLFCLSLGLANCLAGFVSAAMFTASASLCHPPIRVVRDSMFSQTVR